MKNKRISCQKCGKEVIATSNNMKFCPICSKITNKEYIKNYNKLYKKEKLKDGKKKRKYVRKELKNKKSIELEYCLDTPDSIEKCLNCICEECIQPTENDKFLIWEKEEEFYEDDIHIDPVIERCVG